MAKRDEGCGICAGCIGSDPCDDGYECNGGCGSRVTMRGEMCRPCTRESLGEDPWGEDDE